MMSVERLRSLSRLPSPVLTVCLNVGPTGVPNWGLVPSYLTWLKEEAKSVAQGVPPGEQGLFREQLRRVEDFLRQRAPQGKGLMIFAGRGIWESVALQVHIENELHWGALALTQLLWIISEHRSYLVVVVDRVRASFFRYGPGEMAMLGEKKFQIDISQWKKKELGHYARAGIKKTRGSQRDTFEHRMNAQYAALLRETAEQARDLCEREGLKQILLVGSVRLIDPIEAAFPREFQQHVMRFEEDLGRVRTSGLPKRLVPQIAEWERTHEAALVAALLGEERGTVTGMDATLARLQKGEIRTLVMARDLDAGLRRCVECGSMDRSADPVCSACGGERRDTKLLDVLPELVLAHGVDLEVVTGDAASKLKAAGGMGGWLGQPRPVRLHHAAASGR